MKNTKNIKLFVFDMDGTALGGHTPYEQFPRHYVKLLDSLERSGIRWATNTTWGPKAQYLLSIFSKVKSEPACLVGGTGWEVATVKNGEFFRDEEHAKKMNNRKKRFEKKNWPQVRKVFQKLLNRDIIDRLSFSAWGQGMVSLSFASKNNAEVWKSVEPLIESGEYYSFNPNRKGNVITLLPKFQNKGEAMKMLLKRFNLKPENIIVAGDGVNDLHMFEPKYAKFMICPVNASPLVKEKVKGFGGFISDKKYSWGVAEGVRKILES